MVEWKKIKDVCVNICSGGTPSTCHKEYYNGNIPWLRTQEVDWDDILDTEIKITEEAIENSSAKMIPSNCVIVAMYGATAAKVAINRIPLSTNQACCNLEIDSHQVLIKYVYYWLCKEYLNLKALGEGSQNNINGRKIKDYPIPIPSKSEQERIVSILDTFTSSIANLKEQIKERRKQYEHYRDQLLDLEGKEGVEMKKIKEVCDTMSGYPFDSSRFSENGIRLMRGMNVKRGYFDFSEDLNKFWSTSDGLESYLLKENDIIISMDGSLVGRSFSYVNKDLLPLLLVQRVARIRAKENYKYIYYNISKSFPQYVDKKKTAGAIPHISMRDINDFIIPIPSPAEQLRIVTILDQFEASIANLEAQLKEREKQYKYYRNQLLTFE